MRSASRQATAGRSPDITARAHLRDTAVNLFGHEGFGVSVRAIAEAAGVSPALILHHFGSKDGLRQECDNYVLARIREYKEDAVRKATPGELLSRMASMDESAPLIGYALRSLQAGGELAQSFIEHFVEDAEAWLAQGVAAGTIRPSLDEKARARYLTIQGFGTMLLDLALHPPAEPGDFAAALRGYLARNGLPSTELFAQGLMTDRSMLDAYLLYVVDPPA
ncbi:TetR family transcriptional regulator [Pseudarthrobacter sp. J64]|uniref:TetR/AcrR family transcriptional regulator n=1 Tax=Pseudarthrobacter sp. J64 TaxID=3116485 RepID=UPI002E8067D8|nr:TetR family transcriptional regulator [Pseudarthrobacter sp. J64]MEE2568757.1 TetR family transcriptional regulator [Pseudarthrobacter sp. J64]